LIREEPPAEQPRAGVAPTVPAASLDLPASAVPVLARPEQAARPELLVLSARAELVVKRPERALLPEPPVQEPKRLVPAAQEPAVLPALIRLPLRADSPASPRRSIPPRLTKRARPQPGGWHETGAGIPIVRLAPSF